MHSPCGRCPITPYGTSTEADSTRYNGLTEAYTAIDVPDASGGYRIPFKVFALLLVFHFCVLIRLLFLCVLSCVCVFMLACVCTCDWVSCFVVLIESFS